MEPSGIEAELREAGALIVDPRLMRRVILTDRGMLGLSLQVPHSHCYGIGREALLRIVAADEIDADPESLPEEVVLLERPPPSGAARRNPELMRERLLRHFFHARVHLQLERLARQGTLTAARIRERIERIGRNEFDEASAILRHDGLLLPPHDERQHYIEFVALYLELRHFAPGLLAPTFPSLESPEQVDEVIGLDLDVDALKQRLSPLLGTILKSELSPPGSGVSVRTSDSEASPQPAAPCPRPPPSARQARRMIRAGDAARSKGNQVRAAFLYACASRTIADERIGQQVEADLGGLGARLEAALDAFEQSPYPLRTPEQWRQLLIPLLEVAAPHRGRRYSLEARLLFDLQRAAEAFERPRSALDPARWIFSRGKKPLVRPLPATREVRVAGHLRAAARKSACARLERSDRSLLCRTLERAVQRADDNVRLALRSAIVEALDTVGLRPGAMVEQVARDRLVEELLDEIVERGFTSFSRLRDALSRNRLRLGDLSGGRQLIEGDELLQLDRLLARSLDGVYRGGEIYLRGLQRLTSLAFGIRTGRFLFWFFLLPFGGSYLLLEGLGYIAINPLWSALGHRPVALLTPVSFLATALLTLALAHLPLFRGATLKLLGWIGWLLLALFIHLPRWLLQRRAVARAFRIRPVRAALRRVLAPAAAGALAYLLTRNTWFAHSLDMPWAELMACEVFLLVALVSGPRMGERIEELLFDWVAPRWHVFSHQVLPGLIGLIADLFSRLMDRIERAMYRVDEMLRFRPGQNRATLAVSAAAALIWGSLAYLVRMYVTLFVEPELNPLKHFPVATVAHKLTLPILLPVPAAVVAYFETLFPPLLTVALGAFVSVTVFILPSVFGFLAWELKENRKLYRAAMPRLLEPLPFGPHGETVAMLLLPGLHSGTLPKIYERLRRNAQREHELQRTRSDGGARGSAPGGQAPGGYRAEFREQLGQVETAVRRLVQREILALLVRSPGWPHGPVLVETVNCGSHRIHLRLACPALDPAPACEIALEEQGGLLLASMPEPGFVSALVGSRGTSGDAKADPAAQAEPAEETGLAAVLFENALAGLYRLAGVNLVREQIREAIGPGATYDVTGKHLLVWPEPDYRTEIVYKLDSLIRPSTMRPRVRGPAPAARPPLLDRRRVVFDRQQLGWQQWLAAWRDDPAALAPAPLQDCTILPPVPPPSSEPASPEPSA